MSGPRFPEVVVDVDPRASFAVVVVDVRRAMRKRGVPAEMLDAFTFDVLDNGASDPLPVVRQWVTVADRGAI